MYVNKCIKCGREFETKNPKRVICPDCLYPDKKMMVNGPENTGGEVQQAAPEKQQYYSSYSAGGEERTYPSRNTQQGARPSNNRQPGNRPSGNNYGGQRYNNNRPRPQGGRPGGFRPNGRRPQNNRFGNRKPSRPKAPKQLLITKEQLEQIELLYKLMLPLPNPDAHEVIGEKIGLEPRKVFFGINLVRQKMMLPKLPFPKRKLAITPDQMNAVKMLYEPLLPVPPIGCHKIIASQLKMDEWRVHVGIGLIRAQMGLERWNQDRPDVPEEFKKSSTTTEETAAVEEAPKKKRGRPKKEVAESKED